MYDEISSKEMSFIKILQMAVDILKTNFKSILLITLIIFIPINIVNSIIPLETILNEIYDLIDNTSDFDVVTLEILRDTILRFSKWNLVKFAVNQFFGCLAIMAIASIVYKNINKEDINYKVSLEEAFARWLPAAITILLSTSITIMFYCFMLIPALIFLVYTNFIVYIVVLKKQKGLQAIKYNINIVKFRFFKTALRIILISISKFILTCLFASLIFYLNFTSSFIINCLNTLISMFFWIVQTIWFLNYDYVQPSKMR